MRRIQINMLRYAAGDLITDHEQFSSWGEVDDLAYARGQETGWIAPGTTTLGARVVLFDGPDTNLDQSAEAVIDRSFPAVSGARDELGLIIAWKTAGSEAAVAVCTNGTSTVPQFVAEPVEDEELGRTRHIKIAIGSSLRVVEHRVAPDGAEVVDELFSLALNSAHRKIAVRAALVDGDLLLWWNPDGRREFEEGPIARVHSIQQGRGKMGLFSGRDGRFLEVAFEHRTGTVSQPIIINDIEEPELDLVPVRLTLDLDESRPPVQTTLQVFHISDTRTPERQERTSRVHLRDGRYLLRRGHTYGAHAIIRTVDDDVILVEARPFTVAGDAEDLTLRDCKGRLIVPGQGHKTRGTPPDDEPTVPTEPNTEPDCNTAKLVLNLVGGCLCSSDPCTWASNPSGTLTLERMPDSGGCALWQFSNELGISFVNWCPDSGWSHAIAPQHWPGYGTCAEGCTFLAPFGAAETGLLYRNWCAGELTENPICPENECDLFLKAMEGRVQCESAECARQGFRVYTVQCIAFSPILVEQEPQTFNITSPEAISDVEILVWPASLKIGPLSTSAAPGRADMADTMDVTSRGIQRASTAPRVFSWPMQVDDEGWNTLVAFRVEAQGRTKPFLWTHPITGEIVIARFAEPTQALGGLEAGTFQATVTIIEDPRCLDQDSEAPGAQGYSTPRTNSTYATGGCCLEDGSCIETYRQDCLNRGGTYMGDGTRCYGITCEEPPPFDCENDCGTGPCDDQVSAFSPFTSNNQQQQQQGGTDPAGEEPGIDPTEPSDPSVPICEETVGCPASNPILGDLCGCFTRRRVACYTACSGGSCVGTPTYFLEYWCCYTGGAVMVRADYTGDPATYCARMGYACSQLCPFITSNCAVPPVET